MLHSTGYAGRYHRHIDVSFYLNGVQTRLGAFDENRSVLQRPSIVYQDKPQVLTFIWERAAS